jgi:hypothetical protein
LGAVGDDLKVQMLSLVLEAAAQQSVDISNLKSGDVERIELGLTNLLEK